MNSTLFHTLDPTKTCLQNLHVFQPDFTHKYNQISTVGFNMISLVGSNQKRFAKSTRISTWFHPLNSTRFQQLVSTWFHRLDPTKNGLQNLHVFQPDFTHWIQPDFNSWFQHDFTGWIQPKTVCKIYTYFNLISPTEFNQISTVGFNMISPVGSNQKRFAKSTCISTWFHPLNSTRFQQLVSTWFHRLDPTKNGLQNLHVFQPDFTHWIQPDFNSWFQHDFTGWIQLKTVCKIYTYFNQISPLDSTWFQSCVPAGYCVDMDRVLPEQSPTAR